MNQTLSMRTSPALSPLAMGFSSPGTSSGVVFVTPLMVCCGFFLMMKPVRFAGIGLVEHQTMLGAVRIDGTGELFGHEIGRLALFVGILALGFRGINRTNRWTPTMD
ncbi:hypothetical protein [Bifidobacterium merycicum]|uniref:hypothetical protein n=1 Tax=Bifidobacterium merycicum TaxID=78345 RepID=UPI00116033E7|nr:hypothetical protein [Bifidobacterium merycicum]